VQATERPSRTRLPDGYLQVQPLDDRCRTHDLSCAPGRSRYLWRGASNVKHLLTILFTDVNGSR
jgi:hypothetical protein